MIRFRTFAASAFALALVAGGAMAQDTMPADASSTGSMGHMDDMNGEHHMDHMMGMHKMPATVTDIDAGTGIVGVTAGGMALKLHFPPSSITDLKVGDSITVHMGYSKP
ncbi:MAG TPA: hypothetical protein VFW82_05260 [Dyella sp.]|nr:hypothetical protein [Dyella sp.]